MGRAQLLEQTGSCRSERRSGKKHFLSKLHFRQHLATSHFYRGPRGLGRQKWPHQCSRGSRVNGPDGEKGRERGPSMLEEEMSLWLAGVAKCDSCSAVTDGKPVS